MAFLNNVEVYIGAILTDYGRKALAKGDGSFDIVKFAVSDDDIDYSLLPNENDVINIPIMEPITNENFGLINRLVTINRSDLRYMPIISAQNNTVEIDSVTNLTKGALVKFSISMPNNSNVPVELVDDIYKVTVDNNFIAIAQNISNETTNLLEPKDISLFNVATYIVEAEKTVNAYGAKDVNFQIFCKSISNDLWDLFGVTESDINYIYTYCRVEGINSGLNTNIKIKIRKA